MLLCKGHAAAACRHAALLALAGPSPGRAPRGRCSRTRGCRRDRCRTAKSCERRAGELRRAQSRGGAGHAARRGEAPRRGQRSRARPLGGRASAARVHRGGRLPPPRRSGAGGRVGRLPTRTVQRGCGEAGERRACGTGAARGRKMGLR